tara:strand:- start:761 stop:1051 length:291 start_codon:yes stop_codon:yes gene_type:complete
MFQKHRTERGFIEGILVPVAVICVCGVGSWGAWVTFASYDSKNHISEYQVVTSELHEAVDRLVEVEKGFIGLRSEVQASNGTNKILLEAILEQLAP